MFLDFYMGELKENVKKYMVHPIKQKKIRELLQNKGNKKDKITKCKWKILDRGRGCKNIPGTIEGF